MLPSRERLTRRKFSETLANKGVIVVYNRLGTLKYVPCPQKALCVVTSGKHEKKAVVRNKLRRRIYSLFRVNGMPIQGILYTAKASYSLQYPEIQTLFHELLAKTQKQNK
jgi:RNase P protein component